MPRNKGRGRSGLAWVLILTAVVISARYAGATGRTRPELERLPRVTVRRADLASTITAGGVVESGHRTTIECELESLVVPGKSQVVVSQGTSTILSLVPEGTLVHRGDVLCRLDASEFEELLRQQRINVEQARAEHHQATLNLEVARMAVLEYRDGIWNQAIQESEGKIALAQSDWERAIDRLSWSKRMLEKGYLARGQVASETLQERRAALALEQSRIALDIYRRFNAPRTLRSLESQVLAAESILDYQTARLNRQLSRLARLERQVEHCTIRAPHDGLVIYANNPQLRIQIEPGVPVRPKQDLFYLPDLAEMEVSAMLHESIVDQIREGMRAKVRVDGLSDRILEGHIISVAQVPTRNWFSQVPYYVGRVRIDAVPQGLRPGMSAEVEIATRRRDQVLTIPTDALVIEDGREVCYVAGLEGVTRRELKIGQTTRDWLEVVEGLEEGEEVILKPSQSLAFDSTIMTNALTETDRAHAASRGG